MELLLDHVPAGGCVLACDPERIRTRAAELVRTSQEFLEASWVNAAVGGQSPIDLGGAAFRPIEEVRGAAGQLGLSWWTLTPFGTDQPGAGTGEPPEGSATGHVGDTPRVSRCRISANPAESYRGDTGRAPR